MRCPVTEGFYSPTTAVISRDGTWVSSTTDGSSSPSRGCLRRTLGCSPRGSLTVGNWHHVAVTFDGPSRCGLIYIDGVRDRSAVFPVFTPQTAIQPTFGRASWYNGYYLRSILDHARLYPVELTAYQVAADMQSAP